MLSVKQCAECKADLKRRANEHEKRFVARRFCSRKCSAAYGSRIAKIKAEKTPIGSGKVIERNGYKMVWIRGRISYPSQVSGRYVYVHRLVMEEHLGRTLTRKEIIHHINGDPHDNRLDNLELMSQTKHRKIHGATHGPLPHTRKPDVPCAWCGKPFHRVAKRVKCCSQSCGQKLRQNKDFYRGWDAAIKYIESKGIPEPFLSRKV